jgi:tetratricopeptide (TPR) repeat protein
MGCSQSNLQSLVVSPVTNKPQSPAVSQHPEANQQSDRILENCIIVWFIHDSSIDVENEKNRLRQIVSYIKTFTDLNECLNYITNIKMEKVFLIIPSMNSFLHSIQYLPQIEKIYIFNTLFCETKKRSEKILSLKSFHDVDTLCKQLQTDVELCELDLIEITATGVPIQDGVSSSESKKQETKFLYAQLMREILFRIKLEKNAKDEFVSFFRRHYSNNDDEQLRIIDDFEANYRPQKALRWLTRRSFIPKVMQRIQRTPEMDIHYKVCFFAKDVYTQMNIFHENNSWMAEKNWIVYRGKTLTKDRFDTLIKNNVDGLLCFSGFFTANKGKEIAIDFVCQRLVTLPYVIGILFEIHVNSKIRSIRSSFAPFDDIDSDEIFEKNGILFSMYTVFRIESIEQITEKSINMWMVKLTWIADDHPQLLRIVSPLRSSEVQANPLSYLGKFIMDRGDFEYAEYFLLEMLKDTTILNQPHRLTRLHKGIGSNYIRKGEYTQALKHYQKALEVSLNYLSPEHIDLVPIYDEIGNIYYKQSDYSNALQNYEKTVQIVKRNKQPMNDQFINDLNARIDSTKKLLSNRQES